MIGLIRRRRVWIILRVEDGSKRKQRIDGVGIVAGRWIVGGSEAAPSVILREIAPGRVADGVGLVLPHRLAVSPLWLHVGLGIRLAVRIYRLDVRINRWDIRWIDWRGIILLAPSVTISVVSPHAATGS